MGSRENADSLGALVLQNPETFRIYRREDKSLLIQPDDIVEADHPSTPSDEAAAYVQSDDALSRFDYDDPVAFSTNDIIRFSYKADTANPRGESIYRRINDRSDALV